MKYIYAAFALCKLFFSCTFLQITWMYFIDNYHECHTKPALKIFSCFNGTCLAFRVEPLTKLVLAGEACTSLLD